MYKAADKAVILREVRKSEKRLIDQDNQPKE
jgi:hypothetical protein